MCPKGSNALLSHDSQNISKSKSRSAFEIIDADGDGKISHDDLRAFFLGQDKASGPEMIESMMFFADSNKDGYVEFDEFEKVLYNVGEGNNNKVEKSRKIGVMEDAFRVIDKDGDGRVGCEDLKNYLNWAGFEAHDEDVKAMIRLGGGDEMNGGVTLEGLIKILHV